MKSFLKSALRVCLILTLVMASFSMAFAEEVAKVNVPTNSNSFEIVIPRYDLLENGSKEFIVIQESDGTLRAIDSDGTAVRSTAVVCTVDVVAWTGDYVLIDISAEASSPIKKVTGNVKLTTTSLLNPQTLSSFNFLLENPAGSTTLDEQYSAWVGSADAIRVKVSNVYATDLYGNVGSLASWSSTEYRP